MNVSLIVFGDSLLNFTLTTYVEALKLVTMFSFFVQAHEKDNEYQKQIIKSTADLCKIHDGVRANFITKMLMKNLYASADFVLQCPLKPRAYNIWNYRVSDESIPSYLILNDFKFMIEMKVSSKVPKVKTLVHYYTLRFYGEVKKQ